MSRSTFVIPDLSHDEQSTLNALWKQLGDVEGRNAMLSAYYDGESSLRQVGITLPPTMGTTSLVLGWPEKAVDVLNRRCHLEGFRATGVDLADTSLPDLLDANRFDIEFPQAGVSALIHGVSFLVTTQGDTQAGEPAVLVTAKDALSGTGEWDRRRRVLRNFLSVTAVDDRGMPTSLILYVPGVNVVCDKVDGVWKVARRRHGFGVPVEPLVYKPRLDRPFGSSRISRAIRESNNRALRAILRAEITAEFYSVPQRVLLGADETAFQAPDGSTRSAWAARLLSVWAIPDIDDPDAPNNGRAEVKEFSPAPQDPHIAQLRAEAQVFAGLASLPVGELGITTGGDANPTSADAYVASRESLIAEAEGTTAGWAPSLRATAARALLMARESVPDGLQPAFRSPKFTSQSAAADAGMKQVTAIPWLAETKVGLELLGLTPDQIERALAERQQVQGRAAVLGALGRGAGTE